MTKKLYTAAEVTVMTERLDAEIAALREGNAATLSELATTISDLKDAQGKAEAEMRKREAAENANQANEKRLEAAIMRAMTAEARADAAQPAAQTADNSKDDAILAAVNEIGDRMKANGSASHQQPTATPIVMPAAPASYDVGIQRTPDGMLHSLTLTPRVPN